MKPAAWLSLWILVTSTVALGDQWHYNNVLIGERAVGLGGAYTAVSDDASGVYYNPAGLAFALENDISGSANARTRKVIVYEKILNDSNYIETSEGTFAPFFGGLQKLDDVNPGLSFAFGVYTLDSELKNQDDIIVEPSLTITRFHRTINQRGATTGIAVGAGQMLTSTISVGFALTYLEISELSQDYQDAEQTLTTSSNFFFLAQNIRDLLEAEALEAAFGAQWAVTSKLSLGFNYKLRTLIGQSYERSVERSQAVYDSGFNVVGTLVRLRLEEDSSDPLGDWPDQARFGLAYFASTRLLMTFDMMYNSSANGEISIYEREALQDYAAGVEFYVTPQIPLRTGLFTNYDARPEVQEDQQNQLDHIDYYGLSLFLGWVQQNSQLSAGVVLQQGEGKAQKLADSFDVQDVSAETRTLAISATHSF